MLYGKTGQVAYFDEAVVSPTMRALIHMKLTILRSEYRRALHEAE